MLEGVETEQPFSVSIPVSYRVVCDTIPIPSSLTDYPATFSHRSSLFTTTMTLLLSSVHLPRTSHSTVSSPTITTPRHTHLQATVLLAPNTPRLLCIVVVVRLVFGSLR